MNAHAQSIADATRIDGVIVERPKPRNEYLDGIAFGMMHAALYGAQSSVSGLASAFGLMRHALGIGAASELDIKTLRLMSERLAGFVAEADAAQAVIADRIARGRP